MFPGQGSQYVGMGKSLLEEFPYSKLVFEEVEDAAKFPVRKLCLEGPESDLTKTANTQPSILALSIAYWSVLREEVGFDPEYFAGHSLGEYSALVAAGKLALSDAAALVRARGKAMQAAVPEGLGAMAAVLKLDADQLESLCQEISVDGSMVQIANYNNPQQIVVAGHSKAVELLKAKIEELGKPCKMLQVSAPFHSVLMKPAKEEMRSLIESTAIQNNDAKVFSNLNGSVVDYDHSHLIEQIDSSVKWTQTILSSMNDHNLDVQVEIGPGKVLCGLTRRIVPRGAAKCLGTDGDDLISTIKALAN